MLDREQLAAASDEERDRALLSERQAVSRERARVARERALWGERAALMALRIAWAPLRRDPLVPDDCPPEGVVGND